LYDSVPDKFIQVEKVICIFMGLLKKLDIFIWDGEVKSLQKIYRKYISLKKILKSLQKL